jgi:cytochrome c556
MKKYARFVVPPLLFAGASMALGTVASAADDPVEKAIKARRGMMQLYSHYAGPLFGMAKKEMDYDAALASTLAENLNAVVNLSGARMWPPDSHNGARKGKTRAKPDIWKEGSGVGDKSQAMADAALAATLVAGDGLDALRGAVSDIGEACKGCHDDFRAKDF